MSALSYQLLRTARKTLALAIDREGRLTVRAPLWTPQSQIEAFILEKHAWIIRTRARLASLPPRAVFSCVQGSVLPFQGQTLTISLAEIQSVTLHNTTLYVPAGENATLLTVRWLEKQARQLLSARVQALAQRFGFPAPVFRFSRARGRWGSMSARGTLSLNRALILCPPDAVDYVIIHELCHIPHPDHSHAFWAQVERLMPDYREKRAWLKAHNTLISFLP